MKVHKNEIYHSCEYNVQRELLVEHSSLFVCIYFSTRYCCLICYGTIYVGFI